MKVLFYQTILKSFNCFLLTFLKNKILQKLQIHTILSRQTEEPKTKEKHCNVKSFTELMR